MENFVVKSENCFFRNFMGLFSIINNMVNSIRYLGDSGLDGRVNLFYELVKNSSYYHEGVTDTDNVWEYYFKQPSGIAYKDMDRSIKTTTRQFFKMDNMVSRLHVPPNMIDSTLGEIQQVSDFVFKNSRNKLVLQDSVKDKLNETRERLRLNETKYISVHFRYFKVENPNHFGDGHLGKRPEFDIWFNEIDKHITNEHKIFLATDDDISLNAFKEKYGDRLIYNDDNVDRTFTRDIENCGFNPVGCSDDEMNNFVDNIIYKDRKKNPYEIGLDAIIDVYLLSEGDTIIRQCSGLSFFSILLNPKINIINIDTF